VSDDWHGVTQNFNCEVGNLRDVGVPVLRTDFKQNGHSCVMDDFGGVKKLFFWLSQFFYNRTKCTHLKGDFMIGNDFKATVQTGLFVLSLVGDDLSKVAIVNEESELVVFRGGLVFELEEEVRGVSEFILDVCEIVDLFAGDFVNYCHVGPW
jgi:hypothetical protein